MTNLRILDIGCGDGLLLRAIVEGLHEGEHNVVLLDPYLPWLKQARTNLRETKTFGVLSGIKAVQGRVEDCYESLASEADVILAVHLVYLIAGETFEVMIENLPPGVPMYVVLDAPGSIFSALWQVTAPRYLRLVTHAHQLAQRIMKERNYHVHHSRITSQLRNPLGEHPELRDALLSILCYTDVRQLNKDTYDDVIRIIKRRTRNDIVKCESSCYEVVKSENAPQPRTS
jgi:SAM-dependent methyltransferase